MKMKKKSNNVAAGAVVVLWRLVVAALLLGRPALLAVLGCTHAAAAALRAPSMRWTQARLLILLLRFNNK
jgi:hypothetical protein